MTVGPSARTDSLEELEQLLAGALRAGGPTVIELTER